MTLGGWITMILSVGTVLCLFGFCLVRVLGEQNPSEHLHGLDIDTRDDDE
jgi:hypothetical protein